MWSMSIADGVRGLVDLNEQDVEDVLMCCRRIGECLLLLNFHSSGVCGRKRCIKNSI
jgi:hypothetical protein